MDFRKDFSDTTWDEVKKRQLVRFPLVKEWMELAGIKNGDTVMDIGPGPGIFTLQYSKVVGNNGKVIALEKSAEAAAYFKSELQKESIRNVEVHLVDVEKNIEQGDARVNIVMLTDVLHHAENPYRILKNLAYSTAAASVKILISEFDPRASGVIGPPIKNRIDIDRIANWAKELNYETLNHGNQNFEHYFILLQTPYRG